MNTGRVLFEIGGIPIREELAREALRQASTKLPCVVDFITRSAPPRLGNLDIVPDGFMVRAGKLMPVPASMRALDVAAAAA